jgi:hypothetical protein
MGYFILIRDVSWYGEPRKLLWNIHVDSGNPLMSYTSNLGYTLGVL